VWGCDGTVGSIAVCVLLSVGSQAKNGLPVQSTPEPHQPHAPRHPTPTPQGADTVIYERLARNHPTNEALRDVTLQHMEDYGSAGLRTLCLAFREMDAGAYDQ
jgi:hypothetical protein